MCANMRICVVSRCFIVQDVEKKDDDQELPESLQLHQTVVRKIGEICRTVNQVTFNTPQPNNPSAPIKQQERNHQYHQSDHTKQHDSTLYISLYHVYTLYFGG